jgi:uncharacterized protein YsxB (DUF464 family)
MIIVRTTDHEEGVKITLCGHAEPGEDPTDTEHVQVCASVSLLMMTLLATSQGSWAGNKNGFMTCVVPDRMMAHADFAMAGVILVSENYPNHLQFEREDTKLFTHEETSGWHCLTIPVPPLNE